MPTTKLTTVLCLCVQAGTAAAGVSVMRAQVSTDGRSWSNDLTASPGDKVFIRLTATFEGPEHVYGLSGVNMQPTIENWALGDQVAPYVRSGGALDGGYARDKPRPGENAFGRMYEFALPRMWTGDGYGDSTLTEHIHTVSGQRYLRIAQVRTTRWIGEGPTTGTAAFNNFNGGGGIVFAQHPAGAAGSPVPRNYSVQDVVLFKFKIALDPSLTNRDLFVDLPVGGFSRDTSTGSRSALWYATPEHVGGQYLRAPVESVGSHIRVIGPIPAPGALPLLALSAAAFIRRRRA